MVLLVITPAIASALDGIPASTRDELSLPTPTSCSAISHTQLVTLSRHLVSNPRFIEKGEGDANRYGGSTLNSLLKGTRVYVPPPPPKPEPTPEYLALKASLLAEAEANRYNALLHSTSTHPSPSRLWALNDNQNDPLTPSLVLNILVSILFTGFASYWGLSNYRIPTFLTFTSSPSPSNPGAVSSQPARVFISLLVALVVGVAEVGVYALYLKKVELARRKERAIVERKVVVGEVGVGDGDGNRGGNGDDGGVRIDGKGEKEEIWGRGVNGGVRRRVQERWKGRDVDMEG
ncbi:hypothetical protein PABG_07161 [Paracoccidioides brasiliensis Pb03]|uniref:Uncharacterized protein n=2 Tax=Paracoccidioides brasiliensis TaxID=121759 RepID=C1GCY9_PARBD|nr:uncharacterized protein PADG_05125 [Paracoccidioides brasiliensis Pb18]EEH17074.1 hypothetical protein PABG_07161 [Paracoccidioides brasiliensis Pb03]EEH49046.1 hypothetical protein PADG_05125 [Paracoccidioides brasiliensis Pb18]ODH38736.1 hypothetical protein ACO22_02209 [Paracoccidioides brasiliensis]ODH48460.1 hypothetical protein GX48_05437 [Paracoccidioides brasiliensis]